MEEKISKKEIEELCEKINNNEIQYDEFPENLKEYYNLIKILIEKPIEPDPSECCGSGCNPCVYDIYAEKCANYKICLDDIYAKINYNETIKK
jgi:hypothetical protein